MAKFKKGDRVRCIDKQVTDYQIQIGMTGTVLEENDNPYIDWDNFYVGGIMSDLTGHTKTSVRSHMEEFLELIKTEVDLTKIDKPFGLLEPDVRRALEECGGPWQYFGYSGKWGDWTCEYPLQTHLAYRKKPGPVRVAHAHRAVVSNSGNVDTLPADGGPSNATVTYETVDGKIDWSTYRVHLKAQGE